MAIVSVTSRGTQASLRKVAIGYETELVFEVQLSHETDTYPIAQIYAGQIAGTLVRKGDQHPGLPGFFCRSTSASPSGGPLFWTISATYSDSQQINQSDDPLLQPGSYRWSDDPVDVELDTDADGNPIQTTAGEPFARGVVVPNNDASLTYEANVLATQVNLAWLYAFRRKVNSQPFLGAAAGEALVWRITADYVYATADTPSYYKLSIVFLFRETTSGWPAGQAWYERRLNQGFRYLDSEGNLVLATDSQGFPLNKEVLLDASGERTETPYWLYFRIYDSADLNALGITLPT